MNPNKVKKPWWYTKTRWDDELRRMQLDQIKHQERKLAELQAQADWMRGTSMATYSAYDGRLMAVDPSSLRWSGLTPAVATRLMEEGSVLSAKGSAPVNPKELLARINGFLDNLKANRS